MMLAARVIPVMLCKGRQLVKGQRFVNDRVVGHAAQAARIHGARGVDELMLIDVSATAEGRTIDLSLVEELTEDCYIPVTVGGGIRTLEQIDQLLRAGADKVLIGTAAIEVPGLVKKAAEHFGRQAIVGCVDVTWPGGCAMYRRDLVADSNPASHAQWLAIEGVGELLVQRIDRDGTMEGYDLELIRKVSAAVPIPVIACGGCSGYEDMLRAIQAGASAVAAGALFQFEDATPLEAARYLQQHGVEARCS